MGTNGSAANLRENLSEKDSVGGAVERDRQTRGTRVGQCDKRERWEDVVGAREDERGFVDGYHMKHTFEGGIDVILIVH